MSSLLKMSRKEFLAELLSYCSFAASYYTQVRMVGVVGNDFGESDLNRLKARGIDLEGVQRDESGPTFSGKVNTTKTSTAGTPSTSG